MTNLAAYNNQMKINKRLRYNTILEGLREPKTCQQLEKDLNATRNYYNHAVTQLADAGYIKRVGRTRKANIWQAVTFDYREDDVDYNAQLKQKAIDAVTPAITGIYRHDPNSPANVLKYQAQSQQARKEAKSARVWAGTWNYDI